MKYDSINKRIYVRQSWLNDVMLCPERARLGALYPTLRQGSDATIIGTAVHHGIEALLTAPDKYEFTELVKLSVDKYAELAAEPHKETGIAEVPLLIESMILAFTTQVLPHVEHGGKCEATFDVPLGIHLDGYEVYVQGTMDYVTPSGVLWDWKTSSRVYNERDKQASAIQATVYAYAAASLGWVPNPHHVDFSYGVMVRQQKPRGQVVRLHRNSEHFAWLKNQVQSVVHMAHSLGTTGAWLRNDQGNLCSAKWCDFWKQCKGACVSDLSMVVSPQHKAL